MDDKKRQVKKEELIEIIDHYEKRIEHLMERISVCEELIKRHDHLFDENVNVTNKIEREIDMLKRWRG